MPGHSRPPNHPPMETVISGVDLGILSIWFPASKAGRFCASVPLCTSSHDTSYTSLSITALWWLYNCLCSRAHS